MKNWRVIALIGLFLLYPTGPLQAAEHRLGGGANYWKVIDDIETKDIDDNGFSYFASYQYKPAEYFTIEMDMEVLPDKYEETAYAPQLLLLVGKGLYAGAGIGIENCDGDFADDPFFTLRAGVNYRNCGSVPSRIQVRYN